MIPARVRKMIAGLARASMRAARRRHRSKAAQRAEYVKSYCRLREFYLRSR